MRPYIKPDTQLAVYEHQRDRICVCERAKMDVGNGEDRYKDSCDLQLHVTGLITYLCGIIRRDCSTISGRGDSVAELGYSGLSGKSWSIPAY